MLQITLLFRNRLSKTKSAIFSFFLCILWFQSYCPRKTYIVNASNEYPCFHEDIRKKDYIPFLSGGYLLEVFCFLFFFSWETLLMSTHIMET